MDWPSQVTILSENPTRPDGLSLLFAEGFRSQAVEVRISSRSAAWESDAQLLLGYGPHTWQGSFSTLASRLASCPPERRPFFYWWYIESIPDPRLPASIVRYLARLRFALDRRLNGKDVPTRSKGNGWLERLSRRGHRFRILGELNEFCQQGLLGGLAVTSGSRAAFLQRLGYHPIVVPIGYHPDHQGRDLKLTRDIDVTFIGDLRSSRRRYHLLNHIVKGLERHHIKVIVRTHVYDAARTELLNRSKIMLNIFRAPQDFFGMRFMYAAANKALFISEPVRDHEPFEPGRHLVAARPEDLVETIRAYLGAADRRKEIVDAAYRIITEEYTIERMAGNILEHARRTSLDQQDGG